jgi:hypothetical protein
MGVLPQVTWVGVFADQGRAAPPEEKFNGKITTTPFPVGMVCVHCLVCSGKLVLTKPPPTALN